MGFWFFKNNNNVKWQKDYHYHIIRNDEDLNEHVYYILNNPVRAVCRIREAFLTFTKIVAAGFSLRDDRET